MPVQMIELEEVTMIEASDEALEAVPNSARVFSASTTMCPPSSCF
jgi:hypothetical protein